MRGLHWWGEQRNAYVVHTFPWWPVLVLEAELAAGQLAGASFWVGRGAVGLLVGLPGGAAWRWAPLGECAACGGFW